MADNIVIKTVTLLPVSAQLIGPWLQENVAAAQSAVPLEIGTVPVRTARLVVLGGSILGIVARSNLARTAGSLTVEVTVNGAGTGLTAVLDGTNTTVKVVTQAPNLDTVVPGDQLGVTITTSGDWAPTTADITVEVLVGQ